MDARERISAAGGDDARLLDHGRLDRAEPLANPARECWGDVMRTLRLSLVGTVIFALLGWLSVAAVAQTEESATADAPT